MNKVDMSTVVPRNSESKCSSSPVVKRLQYSSIGVSSDSVSKRTILQVPGCNYDHCCSANSVPVVTNKECFRWSK